MTYKILKRFVVLPEIHFLYVLNVFTCQPNDSKYTVYTVLIILVVSMHTCNSWDSRLDALIRVNLINYCNTTTELFLIGLFISCTFPNCFLLLAHQQSLACNSQDLQAILHS